jgi:aspartate racemase
MKKLGLVGGISWISTIDYYRFINEGVNKKLGGLNFAECIIYSLNFANVQQVSWSNTYHLLHQACDTLKRSGVEAIVLCANTAHMHAEKLEADIGIPIIHIVSCTGAAVRQRGLKKVGLLGTKFTMEMDFFSGRLRDAGITCLVPEKQETRDFIQHTLKEELGRGIINEQTRENYVGIINALIANGAEGIILGCTEIPLIINQDLVSVPIFDTTQIHSQAAVDFLLS